MSFANPASTSAAPTMPITSQEPRANFIGREV
jgi:hypothetical protein